MDMHIRTIKYLALASLFWVVVIGLAFVLYELAHLVGKLPVIIGVGGVWLYSLSYCLVGVFDD